ncbi:hypothetical protein [Sphingomonas panni]|uniref:hypothetical protein n=1 Tax=Sphingomonas panni TaxID=237612 RepID=UPI001F5B711B|nr:hypothetical protein [Sphingomonas panni]
MVIRETTATSALDQQQRPDQKPFPIRQTDPLFKAGFSNSSELAESQAVKPRPDAQVGSTLELSKQRCKQGVPQSLGSISYGTAFVLAI